MLEIVRKRLKVVEVTCLEKTALSIVMPLMQATARMVSINGAFEVDDDPELYEALKLSKRQIADMLAYRFDTLISTQDLVGTKVTIEPIRQRFVIELNEVKISDIRLIQPYRLILATPLALQFAQHDRNRKLLTIREKAIKLLDKLKSLC